MPITPESLAAAQAIALDRLLTIVTTSQSEREARLAAAAIIRFRPPSPQPAAAAAPAPPPEPEPPLNQRELAYLHIMQPDLSGPALHDPSRAAAHRTTIRAHRAKEAATAHGRAADPDFFHPERKKNRARSSDPVHKDQPVPRAAAP